MQFKHVLILFAFLPLFAFGQIPGSLDSAKHTPNLPGTISTPYYSGASASNMYIGGLVGGKWFGYFTQNNAYKAFNDTLSHSQNYFQIRGNNGLLNSQSYYLYSDNTIHWQQSEFDSKAKFLNGIQIFNSTSFLGMPDAGYGSLGFLNNSLKAYRPNGVWFTVADSALVAGNFVPYTGANQTVDLNSQTLISGTHYIGDTSRLIQLTIIGTSITASSGNANINLPDSGYAYKTGRIKGIKVYNLGLSGRDLQMTSVNDSSVYNKRYSLIPYYSDGSYVQIEALVNDALSDSTIYTPATWRVQVDSCVSLAINRGFPANHIILSNMAYFNPLLEPSSPNIEHRHDIYSAQMLSEASDRGTLYYDDYYGFKALYLLDNTLLYTDILHPTPKGYTVIANRYAQWLTSIATVKLTPPSFNNLGSAEIYGDLSVAQNLTISNDLRIWGRIFPIGTKGIMVGNGLSPTIPNNIGGLTQPQFSVTTATGTASLAVNSTTGINTGSFGMLINDNVYGFSSSASTTPRSFVLRDVNSDWLKITTGIITTGKWGATPITHAFGGTDNTSYTDGQLLIGNSTGNGLNKAVLTGDATSGLIVTNGPGSVNLSINTVKYIANSTSQQLSSNFNISGTGIAGVLKTGTGAFAPGLIPGTSTSFTPTIGNSIISGVAGIGAIVNDGTFNRRINMLVDNTDVLAGIYIGGSSGTLMPFVIAENSLEFARWSNTGLLRLPQYTTAGIAHFDATGNITSSNIATTDMANNAVTYAKMNVAGGTGRLVGSPSTGTALQDITLGTNLSISAGVLNATGSGGTVTSITPGYGFTSSTPITSTGTLVIDTTTKLTDLAHFNGKIGTGTATALAGKLSLTGGTLTGDLLQNGGHSVTTIDGGTFLSRNSAGTSYSSLTQVALTIVGTGGNFTQNPLSSVYNIGGNALSIQAPSSITGGQTIQWPDASGKVALTIDLTGYLPLHATADNSLGWNGALINSGPPSTINGLLGFDPTNNDYRLMPAAIIKPFLGLPIHGTAIQTGAATTSIVITFGSTLPNNTFFVGITPLNSLTATPYYISAKTTTTFTVTFVTALTGSINFDWNINP